MRSSRSTPMDTSRCQEAARGRRGSGRSSSPRRNGLRERLHAELRRGPLPQLPRGRRRLRQPGLQEREDGVQGGHDRVRRPVAVSEGQAGGLRVPRPLLLTLAIAAIVPPRADRRRQGDQDRRVPRGADPGRRARARPARARGARRDDRRRRQRVPRRRTTSAPARGSSPSTTSGAQAELLLKVKEPIEPRVRAAARGARPLHVPPHRRRRAADARARRRAASRPSRTRRSRPTTAGCRCSRR